MQVWELLAKIDREMMQIDIGLMEWQGNLDMAALAGVGLPFELWTDDDPPRRVVKAALDAAVGKPLRVMHWDGSKRIQIGTGTIDALGNFTAEIEAEVSSEFMGRLSGVSLVEPQYSISVPHAYETLVSHHGSGVVELGAPKPDGISRFVEEVRQHPATKRSIKGLFPDLDNHPFFKEQQ